jgi:hypothetical protein
MHVRITYCCAVGFTQQIYYKTSRICFAIEVGLLQKEAVYVKDQFEFNGVHFGR